MGLEIGKIKDLIQQKPNSRICSNLNGHCSCSQRWLDAHLSVQRSPDAQPQRIASAGKEFHRSPTHFTKNFLLALAPFHGALLSH